ncbi:hypothetical protein D9M71_630460 [compost metagenome]
MTSSSRAMYQASSSSRCSSTTAPAPTCTCFIRTMSGPRTSTGWHWPMRIPGCWKCRTGLFARKCCAPCSRPAVKVCAWKPNTCPSTPPTWRCASSPRTRWSTPACAGTCAPTARRTASIATSSSAACVGSQTCSTNRRTRASRMKTGMSRCRSSSNLTGD